MRGGFSRYIAIGSGPRETIISEGPHILISLAIGIDVLFFSLFGGVCNVFSTIFCLFRKYICKIHFDFVSALHMQGNFLDILLHRK
jgi:hypothetical protein